MPTPPIFALKTANIGAKAIPTAPAARPDKCGHDIFCSFEEFTVVWSMAKAAIRAKPLIEYYPHTKFIRVIRAIRV
jgi:hypothetical protein